MTKQQNEYPDSFNPRHGEEFDLPPVVFVREKGLINKVREVLNDSPELREAFMSIIGSGEIELDRDAIVSLIAEIVDTVPDALPQFVEVITDKDVEWLENHLAMSEMVEIIKLFVGTEIDEFYNMFESLASQFAVETPDISEMEVEEE